MTTWKYMTAQFVTAGLGSQEQAAKLQDEVSALGLYGWEMVSSNVYHNHDIGQDVVLIFFKKPVADADRGA